MKSSLQQTASLLVETLFSEGGLALLVGLPALTAFFALAATQPF